MHPLIQQLISKGPILTDGAWGTELQARGLGLGEFPDAWNLSHPDRVSEVAKSYVKAGSRIILTNTFGANRLRLASDGLAGKFADINRAGVEISNAAARGRALVFASIGPTGKLLMNEDVGQDEMRSAFAEQGRALCEAGADGLILETMSDLVEARLAVEAVRQFGLPVVACMVFDSGKKKDRTMMGDTPEQTAAALTAAGADVIGANCGQGIAHFAPVCRRLGAATNLPIWLKPNAGLPQLVNSRPIYNANPEDFARCAVELVELGASFIGGCCGTTPRFISALRDVLIPSNE